MNPRHLWLPVVALALWLVFTSSAYGPPVAVEKQAQAVWEYKHVYFRWGRTERADRPQLPMEKLEDVMNELGSKGWELTGTVGDVAGDTDKTLRVTTNTNIILFFKRPKR
jgi:hypothetical protein